MELDLKYYATFLTITLIFIVLILRACYYLFVSKTDPIKAILPQYPTEFAKNLIKRIKDREDANERNKFS